MNYLKRFSDDELFNILGSDVEEEIKSRGYEFGWHKKVQYAGVIYIMVNPAFSNLVKIGYADNVENRLKSLNCNSGLPDPYHVYATYSVKKRLEDLKLHSLIDSLDSDLRHVKNKEFYEMSPEKAYDILSAIAEINGDEDLLVKNPLNDDYFNLKKNVSDNNVKNVLPDGIYRFKRNKLSDNKVVDVTATVKNGKWTLLKGSVLGITEDVGVSKKAKITRTLLPIDNNGNLLKDFELGVCSPSHVGVVVSNASVSGWDEWKNKDGQPIDVYRK